MNVLGEAQRLTAAGRRPEAVALVERAAAAGDVDAMLALANWRLFALEGPRDLGLAHRLLERAGAAGSVEAVRTRAALIGNGAGCPADSAAAVALLQSIRHADSYAAVQLEVAAKIDAAGRNGPWEAEMLSEAPHVRAVRKLLAPEECRYLMVLAEAQLRPSFVTHPITGARMPHPVRTSTGMSFGPTEEDLVVRKLNARIAAASGPPAEHGEPLHILRYTRGQEYKPHVDTFAGETNQRDWTVLVYLNEDYRGGETLFDKAGVTFRGGTGDALIFRNVTDDGAPDPLTRHAGLPVSDGVKWLATRWIRRFPYHPWQD